MFESLNGMVAWVPILPLLGALINGIYSFSGVGAHRDASLHRSFIHWIGCGSIFLSFLITVGTFFHFQGLAPEAREVTVTLFNWLTTDTFWADVAFLIDPLSITMMLVVTGVGFLIHVYSIGYMSHDPSYARYFSYLNLFTFAMLLLVMGSNLFMMFIGWEGVGLCSYLLIGFWFTDIEKAKAGMKAFLVNRIGDFGFLIGLLLLFWGLFQVDYPTVTFTELKEAVPLLVGQRWLGIPVVTLVTLLFFVGAVGKSAQIPLYVWLPDAMAGPTPVSALIHAATMVTAGIYMIARLNFLYSMAPTTLTIVAVVGLVTAAFAAVIAFAQNDIKKVLAYSTVSQLGYMFAAMGVGAYAAGILHLVTHSFFKACLFLSSGSVIHALSGEQDMRKMGGLRKKLPVTYVTFLVSALAISGIFPLSGFFSKDEILAALFHRSPLFWILGLVTAGGTAFYMFRLIALTFYGNLRAEPGVRSHIHESPSTMTIPLVILAILSVVGGWIGLPESLGGHFGISSHLFQGWLQPVFTAHSATHSPSVEVGLMILSLAVAIGGVVVGIGVYTRRQDLIIRLTKSFPTLYHLVLNKFFVDEIYEVLFVRSFMRLKEILGRFDLVVIDGFVNLSGLVTRWISQISGWFDQTFVDGAVNLVADGTFLGSSGVRQVQNGRIQSYVYFAVGGVLAVLIYRFL